MIIIIIVILIVIVIEIITWCLLVPALVVAVVAAPATDVPSVSSLADLFNWVDHFIAYFLKSLIIAT